MSTESRLVDAHDLHVHYGESHVLRGVSLSIRAGEAVGLLGRNGMGKTTLIRTIMGHLRASRGSIRIRDGDGSRMPADRIARAGIAYVPEGRAIFPNLSVRENLVMAARPCGDASTGWTYRRVLATFPRLGQRLRHLGAQLSGGEQQMLSIGRALLTQPRLIILDEATEGLAPKTVLEIWRVIDEIRASGIATLIVDRNYRKVLQESDSAVVLLKGRVVLAEASRLLRERGELASHLGV